MFIINKKRENMEWIGKLLGAVETGLAYHILHHLQHKHNETLLTYRTSKILKNLL